MTHDPLCPVSALLERHTGVSVLSCQCNLIARVREDERTNEPPAWAYANGYDTALQDAIDAVNKFINNPEDDWDKAIDNLFIKKIVEAIESSCNHTKYKGCPPCPHDIAISRAYAMKPSKGSE